MKKKLHAVHVVPLEDGWTIEGLESQPMDTKRIAIDYAFSVAPKPGNVVIHGKKGQPVLRAVGESKLDERKVRSAVRSIQDQRRARKKSRPSSSRVG